jgi:uncharacterized RDD family membrane protein YckC
MPAVKLKYKTPPVWYYVSEEETKGPISKSELIRLVEAGKIEAKTLVWRPGIDEWKCADEIDHFAVKPPPIPKNDPSVAASAQSVQNDNATKTEGENMSPGKNMRPEENMSPAENDSASGEKERATLLNRITFLDNGQGRTGQENSSTGSSSHLEKTLEDLQRDEEWEGDYASFGKRFIGLGVDMAFLAGVYLVVSGLYVVASALIMGSVIGGGTEGLQEAIVMLGGWVYFAGFESSSYKATLGKRAVEIVVRDTNGEGIGFWKATGRHLGKLISGAFFMIGFLMAAFTEKHQGLHDKMAGCIVTEEGASKTSASEAGMGNGQETAF